jgi:hypothetical protein
MAGAQAMTAGTAAVAAEQDGDECRHGGEDRQAGRRRPPTGQR